MQPGERPSAWGSQGWEPIWADEGKVSDYWLRPDPDVMAWAEGLWAAGGRRVLDLGCGLGRHVIALARRGFRVTGCDISPTALARCRAWLAREGLTATLIQHPMTELPYPDGSFDGVLAMYVVYHATRAQMERTLAEVGRVLVPGGRFYATFIARDQLRKRLPPEVASRRIEIEPFTFVDPGDVVGDKGLPHHYCDEAEVRHLLAGFVIDDLRLNRREETDDRGRRKLHSHYHVQARRKE